MITETIVGVACVLVGLVVILTHFAPESPAVSGPALERARMRRGLGLGHRFAARVIGSSVRPADEKFVAVAVLYQMSTVRIAPAHLELASPFVELEQLLERIDRLMARARSWRERGRARGPG